MRTQWTPFQLARRAFLKSSIFCCGAILTSFTLLGYAEEKRLQIEGKEKEKKKFWYQIQHIFPTHATEPYVSTSKTRFLWELEHSWLSLSSAHKTLTTLIAINTVVFFGWKIPSLIPFMERHFLHSPLSRPHTLLTSTFSHSSFLHLSFNMMALYSFGSWAHDHLGREQFLFMYLSAGMISSLTSQAWKVWIQRGNMLYTPSLGASGAIFSLVGATAHRNDMSIGVLFLPGIHLPAPVAVAGMAGIDAYFLLFKNAYSKFDHAAHLGGSAFGYLYYAHGPSKLWSKKKTFLGLLNL